MGLTLLFPAAASYKSDTYLLSALQLLVDVVGIWGLVGGWNASGEGQMAIMLFPIFCGGNRLVSLPLNALAAHGYNRRQGKSIWNSQGKEKTSSPKFHPYEGDQKFHGAIDFGYLGGGAGDGERLGAMIGYDAWALRGNYYFEYATNAAPDIPAEDTRKYSFDLGYRFQPSKRFSIIPTAEIAQGSMKYWLGPYDNLHLTYSSFNTMAYTDLSALVYGSFFVTEGLEGSLTLGYPVFQSSHYRKFSNNHNHLYDIRTGFRVTYNLL